MLDLPEFEKFRCKNEKNQCKSQQGYNVGDNRLQSLSEKYQLMKGIHSPPSRENETDFFQGRRNDFDRPPAAPEGRHGVGYEDVENDKNFDFSDDASKKDTHAGCCPAEEERYKKKGGERISEEYFENDLAGDK